MVQEMEKVEQLLAMLKIAGKGPGLKDAVSRALAEPSLFVYGELVQLSSIQELQGTDQEYLLRTLKLFAFGTFAQYREAQAQYMELSDVQVLKLKQLSICTLVNAHVTGYDALLQALDLPTVRALEDFIIQHCLYTGLLKCQLDQRHRRLHVQEVYHRDVEPSQLPQLTAGLQQLCDTLPSMKLANVRQVMRTLDQNVTDIATAHTQQVQAQADAERKFEQAKQSSTMMEHMDAEGEAGMVDESFAPGLMRGALAAGSSRGSRARSGPDAKKSRK